MQMEDLQDEDILKSMKDFEDDPSQMDRLLGNIKEQVKKGQITLMSMAKELRPAFKNMSEDKT